MTRILLESLPITFVILYLIELNRIIDFEFITDQICIVVKLFLLGTKQYRQ